jgi:membrane-associated phospholipid phosphatase
VTAANVFRGTAPGCTVGPYVSQFLLQTINFGSTPQEQRYRTGMPGVDYLTGYPEWLLLQSGLPPYLTEQFDPTFRYIHSGRNLAQFVHYDYLFQAFLQAALILAADYPETLLTPNVSRLSSTNPYKTSNVQTPYTSFGLPLFQDWLGRVGTLALKTVWHDKWAVHRRARPEMFSGRVYNTLTGAASYPIHPLLLNSHGLQTVIPTTGGLLPQAYVEGCPLHPSYPAGHAAVAGACGTLMKALFDEKEVLSSAVAPSADGLSLTPYTGTALTVGGEFNKLAFNVPMARNWAGIHYRSDTDMSHIIGEQVAICFLQDQVNSFTEPFPGFSFTMFDGTPISIVPGGGAYTGMNKLTPGY